MSDSEKEERFFQFWKKHVGFLLNVLPEEERQAHINNLEKKKGYDQHVQCVKWQRYLESYSPIVRFMLEECEKIGAHPLMECVKCDDVKSGGFDPELGIQFCENHLRNKQQLEDTMAHELVHAYDNQYPLILMGLAATSGITGNSTWIGRIACIMPVPRSEQPA